MRIVKLMLPVLIICILFSGCNQDESLADLAIVEAVGIDYKDDETSVVFQYLNLEKSNGTTDALSGGITSIATGSSNGISNAVAATSSSLSKEIFFGQNKIIVFGREYIDYGIEKGLDYLLRSVDSRPDVLVAMSEKTANEVITNELSGARIPAESLSDLLKTGEKNGFSAVVVVSDILNMYADKTSDIYLPVISPKEKNCDCSGIAVFSNEKYKATLNRDQTLGFLILKSKTDAGFINVDDKELGRVSLEMISSKAKNRMIVDGDEYVFECDIKMALVLDEIENGITSAIDEKKIERIEALVNSKIRELCTNAFNKCISEQSDALALGRYLARSHPEKYNAVKDDWKKELPKIRIRINASSNLEKVNDTALSG